jgi:hypothetical protein
MTIRYSTALRNFLLKQGSMARALGGGKLNIYSGPQPATANTAASGTLLATITADGGAHTAEVRATGTVTLDSGASGSVDSIEVEGIEVLGSVISFTDSLTATAALVAAAINDNPMNSLVEASSDGAVITLTAKLGLGALANGLTVVSASTTIATTDVNLGSGVTGVSSVNGLLFGEVSAGVLSKLASQEWTGLGLADGTAGWFRFVGPVADAGATDSAAAFNRIDGNIATSGANMNMTNTNIVTGATQTVNTGTVTVPATA